MSPLKRHALLLAAAALAWCLGACQTIAGIEERKLDENSESAITSQLCGQYCDTVLANCLDEFAVYPTKEQCMAVCKALPQGDSTEHTGNTVWCRLDAANSAKREPADYCPQAGPGGGAHPDGSEGCGTDCEAYCSLYPKLCPGSYEYESTEDCIRFCGGLTNQSRFDLKEDHEGDTIECRLVHTSSASLKPEDHCPHAPIPPTAPWCTGKPDAAPTCDEYCNIEMAACQGELAQYASLEQCKAVCGALDLGVNSDQSTNTVACRRYHSFSSTLQPSTHCYHSGPTGDGHCGDKSQVTEGHTGNCESYCKLAAAACEADFTAKFGTADKCMEECVGLDEAAPDSKYTVMSAESSTGLHCRILHTVLAFKDTTACASALGDDQCQ